MYKKISYSKKVLARFLNGENPANIFKDCVLNVYSKGGVKSRKLLGAVYIGDIYDVTNEIHIEFADDGVLSSFEVVENDDNKIAMIMGEIGYFGPSGNNGFPITVTTTYVEKGGLLQFNDLSFLAENIKLVTLQEYLDAA